jgi:hypothetical protein
MHAMPHVFEPAPTGRAKCRGCGEALPRGEIRFGEELANPYAEGAMMTIWFHPRCAAYKRPQAILEALASISDLAPDLRRLEPIARASAAGHRLARIDGAQRSPGTQARCRHCHELIEKGTWRIRLVFFEEGRFNPSGYIHIACAPAYFETADVLDAVAHFSPSLTEAERAELAAAVPKS